MNVLLVPLLAITAIAALFKVWLYSKKIALLKSPPNIACLINELDTLPE